jgi:hypothetical protein
MKRGRVPLFGATQWTITGWQKTMSPSSPADHHVAVALEALDVC